MPYETQPGTIPHRAVEHLQSLDKGVERTTADFAAALEVEQHAFVQCMAAPRKHGLVTVRRSDNRGRALLWSLGEGVPQVAESEGGATDAEPDIRWTIWDDGDLVVYGLEQNEDGSHTVPAKVLDAIKRRTAWSPTA